MDVERLLKDVDGVCSHSDAGGGCEVTAVSAHGLHDEDAAFGSRRRLLDFITALSRQTDREKLDSDAGLSRDQLDVREYVTSMAAFTAVSAPKLKSVPGTLLLMVAGITHIAIHSSS